MVEGCFHFPWLTYVRFQQKIEKLQATLEALEHVHFREHFSITMGSGTEDEKHSTRNHKPSVVPNNYNKRKQGSNNNWKIDMNMRKSFGRKNPRSSGLRKEKKTKLFHRFMIQRRHINRI
jgi:hypothetical protein